MTDKKYTLVAYKESSDDYCRGCVLESYSDDFDIIKGLSEEEVVEKIASLNSRKFGYGELRYVTYVIEENNYDQYPESGPTRITDKAKVRTTELIAEREEQEKEQKRLELERAKMLKEEKERKTYAELKRKFEEK